MDLPLRIVVRELAPGLNGPRGLERMHWATKKRQKDRWNLMIRSQLDAPPPAFVGLTDVHIIRRRRKGPPMDEDNAHATAKIPLDALQALGVIDNDRNVRLSVSQELDAENWGTEILIQPAAQEDHG